MGALTWVNLLLKGLELSSLRLFAKIEAMADRAPLLSGSLPKNLPAPEEINGGDGTGGLRWVCRLKADDADLRGMPIDPEKPGLMLAGNLRPVVDDLPPVGNL